MTQFVHLIATEVRISAWDCRTPVSNTTFSLVTTLEKGREIIRLWGECQNFHFWGHVNDFKERERGAELRKSFASLVGMSCVDTYFFKAKIEMNVIGTIENIDPSVFPQ